MNKATELAESIESIASRPTERKNPTNEKPVNESTINQQPPQTTQQTVESKPAEFYTDTPENVEQSKIGVLKEDAIKASGVAGAFIAADTTEFIFTILERVTFMFKFSTEERARIVAIDEKSESELDEYDHRVNRKFIALTNKHEKIRTKIPITKEEREALELAFTEYTRATGKSVNPQLILYSSLIKIFANRSIDLFL